MFQLIDKKLITILQSKIVLDLCRCVGKIVIYEGHCGFNMVPGTILLANFIRILLMLINQ